MPRRRHLRRSKDQQVDATAVEEIVSRKTPLRALPRVAGDRPDLFSSGPQPPVYKIVGDSPPPLGRWALG